MNYHLDQGRRQHTGRLANLDGWPGVGGMMFRPDRDESEADIGILESSGCHVKAATGRLS
jgi:hypothetical protein